MSDSNLSMPLQPNIVYLVGNTHCVPTEKFKYIHNFQKISKQCYFTNYNTNFSDQVTTPALRKILISNLVQYVDQSIRNCLAKILVTQAVYISQTRCLMAFKGRFCGLRQMQTTCFSFSSLFCKIDTFKKILQSVTKYLRLTLVFT